MNNNYEMYLNSGISQKVLDYCKEIEEITFIVIS